MKWSKGTILFSALAVLAIMAGIYFVLLERSSVVYSTNTNNSVNESSEEEVNEETVAHIKTPEEFKALYMTQCVVGTPSFRDSLVDLIEKTELNAVVIDIKDFSGTISFETNNPRFSAASLASCGARDMESFIERLHDSGVYVVGRITVFQDPLYTKAHPEQSVQRASDGSIWTDFKGLSFVDPSAKPFWDYITVLSKEAYALGFDEINYDYIRFPSDGNMKDIAFPLSGNMPKEEAIEAFFAHLYETMADGESAPVLSADLFGMTTTNTDDLNIGQVLERALPYFDYVMPMVYPSHYPTGFNGWQSPATLPYEVVYFSMQSAVRRAEALRDAPEAIAAIQRQANSTSTPSTSTPQATTTPHLRWLAGQAQKGHTNVGPHQLRSWIQDFDLGTTYTPEMVRAQIQATYDAGVSGWALWDAGNTYTESALLPE